MAIGEPRICIGHDEIRRNDVPAFGFHAAHLPSACDDFIHLFAKTKRASLFFDHFAHRIGKRLNTAHGIMHPKGAFEMRHKNIHRRDIHRIPADKERMKRQRHTQPRVPYPFGRMGIDRAIRAQHCKTGEFLDQIPQFVHRLSPHAFKAKRIPRLAVF